MKLNNMKNLFILFVTFFFINCNNNTAEISVNKKLNVNEFTQKKESYRIEKTSNTKVSNSDLSLNFIKYRDSISEVLNKKSDSDSIFYWNEYELKKIEEKLKNITENAPLHKSFTNPELGFMSLFNTIGHGNLEVIKTSRSSYNLYVTSKEIFKHFLKREKIISEKIYKTFSYLDTDVAFTNIRSFKLDQIEKIDSILIFLGIVSQDPFSPLQEKNIFALWEMEDYLYLISLKESNNIVFNDNYDLWKTIVKDSESNQEDFLEYGDKCYNNVNTSSKIKNKLEKIIVSILKEN